MQAGARLGEAALPLLANEAYRETLTVARFERDYKTMAQAHNEIHQFMKKAMQQETQVNHQMSRVFFFLVVPRPYARVSFSPNAC